VSDVDWSANQLFQKVKEIEALLPRLEKFSAEVASELSGLSVTPMMFRRMGGMWLMHLAHQIVGNSAMYAALKPLENLTVPTDSWGHHELFVSDRAYQAQVVAMASPRFSEQVFDQSNMRVSNLVQPKLSGTRLIVEGLTQRLRQVEPRVVVAHPYLKMSSRRRLKIVSKSSRYIMWDDLPQTDTGSVSINPAVRYSYHNSCTGDDVISRISRVVSLMMPTSYGENLAEAVQCYASRRQQPTLLYSATGSQKHLPYQVLSAVWGASGTRILSHQHGGHQGLDEVHAGEEVEVRSSDVHYSFGWRDHRSNIRPLPTALPTMKSGRSRKRLLLMSLAMSDVVYRLQPFCIPAHVQTCFGETRTFLTNLIWPELPVVRCGERESRELRINVPHKTETTDVAVGVSMGESAIVVHNYFGASWLESLALNVPTVCFVPDGLHTFREAARPFIDALTRVGIIHHSGKEAARFINGLNGNPSAWWNSPEVQEAREAFVARYANFSEDWIDAWTTEFDRLLAER
jgi:putative transferase (TIGR04331 family)